MKEKLKTKLKDTASTVEGQRARVSKAMEEISQVKGDIVSCERKCQREIDESFEALYRTLQKHQQIMKERVAEQLKAANIEEKKKELTSILSEISRVVGQASQSLEEGELDFLMMHFPIIQQRLEKLQDKLSNTPLDVPDRPQFITTKVLGVEVLEQLLEKHNGLHSFDPTKWQVSGRFLIDAQVGKRYTLTVESNKGQGKLWRANPSQKGVVKLEAELVSVRDKSITRGEIQDHSQYRFIVHIQPLVRGRHKLSIKINGVHISNSPFDVFVHLTLKQLSKPVGEIPGLQRPISLCFSEGKLMVTEWGRDRVLELPAGTLELSELNTRLKLNGITAITTDPRSGAIFVTTTVKHEVHKFASNGNLIKTVGGLGAVPGAFDFPNGLRISKQNELYVCDSYNNRMQVFDLDLNFKRSFGSAGTTNGQFSLPSDVNFDASGKIYVSDSKNHRVQVFSSEELFLFAIGDHRSKPLCDPVSLSIYKELLFVTEIYSHRVSVVTPSGELVSRFGEGYLQNPEGITIDEDGYVYVTSHHSKILMF